MKRLMVILLALSWPARSLPRAAGQRRSGSTCKGLTPREKLESERVSPPSYLWTAAKEWQKLHPGMDDRVRSRDQSDYEEWFTTQMVGGIAPDIVWYQRGWIQRDYKKNWFADLTPALSQKNPYAPSYASWYDIVPYARHRVGDALLTGRST